MRELNDMLGNRQFDAHQSLDHADAAAAVVGLKCDEFLGRCCLNTNQQQQWHNLSPVENNRTPPAPAG